MSPIVRPRVIFICSILILGMLRASYWQWERHLEKQVTVRGLEARLLVEPVPVLDLIAANTAPDEITYRRVLVEGTYDFDHEMTIRNRRLHTEAGVHVLTPLKIAGSERWIVVNRGFAPLGLHEDAGLASISRPKSAHFMGLLKISQRASYLAPQDTIPAEGSPFVRSWLRPDLESMAKQLPYSIASVYLEIMEDIDPSAAKKSIVSASNGREDIMMLKEVTVTELGRTARPTGDYPVPVFDTVAPATRHLGYVYEWAAMALATLLIGIVLHLKGARTSCPRSSPIR